jgi:hypothetical protein
LGPKCGACLRKLAARHSQENAPQRTLAMGNCLLLLVFRTGRVAGTNRRTFKKFPMKKFVKGSLKLI